MSRDSPGASTRRAILQSIAATLGIGAVGTAAGHPGAYEKGSSVDERDGTPFALDDGEQFENTTAVGYHSIGGVGSAGLAGRPGQRHPADRNAEVRTHGDVAVTCFRAADDEDPGRRLAVLDISEFNDAATPGELEDAELRVHSILRNFSAEANGATDVKLSGDGDYAFLGTQALVPYDGGSNGALNETDPRGNLETSGGVVAVDISDPSRPRTVDRVDAAFSTGIHNLFHHRIDGVDYVFACKDAGLVSPDSGVYVLRFDRDPGKLTVVNRWSADGNTVRGGVGPEHGLSYVHDVEVHDDPRTGRPTAYVADWDRGMRVLDVSDPTDIQHVGQFDMYQSHFAAPFPQLIETPNGTKRVAVASHEEPDERFDQRSDVNSYIYNTPHQDKCNPNSTGTVFLVDCDGIYPEDPNYDDGAGPKQLGELDNWTWKNVDTGKGFDADTPRSERFEQIHQPTFSFQLSPHNSQPAVHEIDDEKRYLIHQSHYHGGVRHLEVRPGTATEGLTGEDRRDYRPKVNPNATGQQQGDKIGWIHHSTDWDMVDVGHARPTNETTGNVTPDFWSAVEQYGVTYSGDRGAGVWVTYYDGNSGTDHEAIPLEKPRPPVDVTRTDDGNVFLGNGNNEITIEVTAYERDGGDAADLLVRDRMPNGYGIVAGDVDTYSQGVRTAVEFAETVEPGETVELAYIVSVSEDPGPGTFGPVEISGDGGDTWVTVAGTTDSNVSTGAGL